MRPPAPLLALALALASGCASSPETPEARRHRAAQLALGLAHVSPRIPAGEARIFSRVAVERCADLREKYRIGLNHNLHNALVYWGMKDRGFCWHWQEDLRQTLEATAHPHLELHAIVASPGSLWHEHHALSVTAPGTSWNEGLVLDPWREEGRLWFGPVKTDDFPWMEEP